MSRASQIAELAQVVDLIHDRWFDVDDVSYDEGTRSLLVRFRSDLRNGIEDELLLVIRDVDSYQLEETEGVGRYDFNEFAYLPQDRALKIRTGVPLIFELVVASLDVELKRPVVTGAMGRRPCVVRPEKRPDASRITMNVAASAHYVRSGVRLAG